MNDKALCEALDAVGSVLRRSIAVAAAERRDAAVDRGEDALAEVFHALAALAVEAEDIERARFAEMARELRWAPAVLVEDDDDRPEPTP